MFFIFLEFQKRFGAVPGYAWHSLMWSSCQESCTVSQRRAAQMQKWFRLDGVGQGSKCYMLQSDQRSNCQATTDSALLLWFPVHVTMNDYSKGFWPTSQQEGPRWDQDNHHLARWGQIRYSLQSKSKCLMWATGSKHIAAKTNRRTHAFDKRSIPVCLAVLTSRWIWSISAATYSYIIVQSIVGTQGRTFVDMYKALFACCHSCYCFALVDFVESWTLVGRRSSASQKLAGLAGKRAARWLTVAKGLAG